MTARTERATLAERAAIASARARTVDPDIDSRPADPLRGDTRRSLTRAITAALGIDPVAVLVTDDPARKYGTWRGFLITVSDSDGATYRFIPKVGSTDLFLILGECAACHREVPVATVTDLAELGSYLDAQREGRTVPTPPGFAWDQGHAADCPERKS